MSSALVGKASSADIGRALTEITSTLDEKCSIDDCKHLLGDYVLKTDFFQYSADLKSSIQDIRQFLDTREDTFELQKQITSLNHKIDDLNSQMRLQFSSYVQQNEFDRIKALVESKANIDYVNEALEKMVNKRAFNDSLLKKANRSDVEALLSDRTGPVKNQSFVL